MIVCCEARVFSYELNWVWEPCIIHNFMTVLVLIIERSSKTDYNFIAESQQCDRKIASSDSHVTFLLCHCLLHPSSFAFIFKFLFFPLCTCTHRLIGSLLMASYCVSAQHLMWWGTHRMFFHEYETRCTRATEFITKKRLDNDRTVMITIAAPGRDLRCDDTVCFSQITSAVPPKSAVKTNRRSFIAF